MSENNMLMVIPNQRNVKELQLIETHFNNLQKQSAKKEKKSMKIEEQVCTMEQAKKIKELGLVQNGHFFFLEGVEDLYTGTFLKKIAKDNNTDKAFCAFSSAELGKVLASLNYEAWGHDMVFSSYVNEHGWIVHFRNPRNFKNPDEYHPTEAQARAAMLIFLLEEKLMTPDYAMLALTTEEENPRSKM